MSSVESFMFEEGVWVGQMLPIIIVGLQGKVHRRFIQTITLREGDKNTTR